MQRRTKEFNKATAILEARKRIENDSFYKTLKAESNSVRELTSFLRSKRKFNSEKYKKAVTL